MTLSLSGSATFGARNDYVLLTGSGLGGLVDCPDGICKLPVPAEGELIFKLFSIEDNMTEEDEVVILTVKGLGLAGRKSVEVTLQDNYDVAGLVQPAGDLLIFSARG